MDHTYIGDHGPVAVMHNGRQIAGAVVAKATGTGNIGFEAPYKAQLPSVVVKGEGEQNCTFLEYLQSNGDQYIISDDVMGDLGDIRIRVKFKLDEISRCRVIGACNMSSGDYFNVFVNPPDFGTQLYNGLGNWGTVAADTNIHDYELSTKDAAYWLDGVCHKVENANQSDTPYKTKIGLFCANWGDNRVSSCIRGRIYYYEFFKNGKPVTKMRPILDNNGKPAMYDIVRQKVYYGANLVNDFVPGPHIKSQLVISPTPEFPVELRFLEGASLSDGSSSAQIPILRALPDGSVKDEIDLATGTVVRRIGRYEYTGAEPFDSPGVVTPGYKNYRDDTVIKDATRVSRPICSHFQTAIKTYSVKPYANMLTAYPYGASYQIIFQADEAKFPDVSTWKKFLADQKAAGTPVTIWYPLATPIIEHVDPAVLRQHPGYTQLIQQGGFREAEISCEHYQEIGKKEERI